VPNDEKPIEERKRNPPPVVVTPFVPTETPRAQVITKGFFVRHTTSGKTTFKRVRSSASWHDILTVASYRWLRNHPGHEVAGIGFIARDVGTKEVIARIVKGDVEIIGETVMVNGRRVKVVQGQSREGTTTT